MSFIKISCPDLHEFSSLVPLKEIYIAVAVEISKALSLSLTQLVVEGVKNRSVPYRTALLMGHTKQDPIPDWNFNSSMSICASEGRFAHRHGHFDFQQFLESSSNFLIRKGG